MSTPRMNRTLRALAWLLRYPDAPLRDALPELRDALHAECALGVGRLAEIDALCARLQRAAPFAAEAEYVELFDRSRRLSLHLFEHLHGDSRERGPALVALARTYEEAGLLFDGDELPDHLPVVLEFASTQPPAQARAFLRETAPLVRLVFSALQERRSAYAAALAAVLDLAGERAERVALPADDELDEAWAEPPAFGGCSVAGQARPGMPQPVQVVRRNPARGASR